MNETDKNRINQYFDTSSTEDEHFIANSFLDDGNETELKMLASEHWDRSSSKKVDLQHVLNQIHFLINTSPAMRPKAKSSIMLAYSRVAAILFIPLLIAGIYLISQTVNLDHSYSEILAPKGSRIQFTLPDGSKGYLNSGSTLRYPSKFRKERKVTLTGEGYFEVSKDTGHPFTVQTKFADILVMGTKFDVCAYNSDQEVVTTLEEGSVRVISKKDSNSASLHPGEQNRINILNGEMISEKVDTKLFTSWKEEMLRFDNAPFAEVVRKMERWYGVRITLDKSLQYSDNYTMTIKTESLREMLQLLSITTPMEYEVMGNKVFIYQQKNEDRIN
jgi:ferric-dicitrate binding protein FerR (iron transport regulator)